jgi:hypothetical protein
MTTMATYSNSSEQIRETAMTKTYVVKRFGNGTWGGMYNYTALCWSEEMARQQDLWAKREANGKPVILLADGVIIDQWAPDGVIPPTHAVSA